jgi:putative IMPACT (imprinted ancient) family translation regulator
MPSTLLDLCEFREEIRKSRFITLAGRSAAPPRR